MTRRHTPLQAERHAAARARIRAGEGFIYLAEIVGLDLLKIGFSLCPENRIGQLFIEYHRHAPIRLLAKVPGTLSDEMRLHGALRPCRAPYYGDETYPLSILTHPAIPVGLRGAP